MPSSPVNRVTARQDPSVHHAELLAYARRMLGDEGRHAEDVVQEAYLRLAEQDAAGRRPDDDRRWLFRVVRNLALDERRRARHAAPLSDETLAGAGDGPGDVLEHRQAAERTLQEVAALPPQQRRALVLDQAGMPTAEIARRMSTSENAVHQALFRARRRLRHARSAAWGVIPLPVARFMIRAGDARLPEVMVAAGTPGGGGRLLPLAGVMGAAAVGLIGGGTVVHELAEPPDVIRSERTGLLSQATTTPVTPAPGTASTGTGAPRRAAAPSRTTQAAPRVRPAAARASVVSSRAVRRAPVAVTRARAVTAPPAAAPAASAPRASGTPSPGTTARRDGGGRHTGGDDGHRDRGHDGQRHRDGDGQRDRDGHGERHRDGDGRRRGGDDTARRGGSGGSHEAHQASRWSGGQARRGGGDDGHREGGRHRDGSRHRGG
ncbi:MAG: sigma-70 family RNA polymerase sigma factor [Thermoleophilia bacterium]